MGFTAATTLISTATTPHTLTAPDDWACYWPVFAWKIFEISMIRIRASPPQSGQERRQSKSPPIRTAQPV